VTTTTFVGNHAWGAGIVLVGVELSPLLVLMVALFWMISTPQFVNQR
jgi:hypothetical protein